MKQLLFPVLAILLVLSALFGMVSWMSAISPREAGMNWSVRIATAIIFTTSLIGLIALAKKPESVPDFLGELKRPRMGRGGIVFVFDCVARDNCAFLEIHYQNRHAKSANVVVAVQPAQNFTMSRNNIEPVLVQFACGPAAYGVVHVPIALKREYQGRAQLFDIAEQSDYPQGTGPTLRNSVGPAISKLNVSTLGTAAVALAKLALTGHLLGLKVQSRVKVNLPMGVTEPGAELPPISQDETWTLPESALEK